MKLLILGGGPAGCAAAWYARQKGIDDITIVEQEGNLGGCSKTNFYQKIPYEFGPQVLYTDENDIREVFEKFVSNKKPPTEDGQYHPKVFPYGVIDDPHDFPITVNNVLKQKNPAKVIYELYQLNLEKPDFSNFENYMISRIGKALYKTYVRNYNVKQWKMDPKDMDADWAKLRTLTLREKNDMFQNRWQGHPGNYAPLWSGLTKSCNIIQAKAEVSEDMAGVSVNGEKIDADLIVSTLPLGKDFDYLHTLKIFVGLKNPGFVMPSYANSFPNNYDFTRVLDYKQQFFVDSEYSLLSFAFSWNDKNKINEEKCVKEVKQFVKDSLKSEISDIWSETRLYTYPVHNGRAIDLLDKKFELAANAKIVPMGRCGVHAYVSKDVCFRMARIIMDNIDKVLSGGREKKKILYSLREKLR
jgi:UDP-galactopyranose mutase